MSALTHDSPGLASRSTEGRARPAPGASDGEAKAPLPHPFATVATWFDRGVRRSRGRWLAISGRPCSDGNGLRLRFCLEVEDGVILDAAFEGTTCVTLIAYCEVLAEWVAGMPLADAIRISPRDLVRALPGVPPSKQDRAVLPIDALRSAIQAAVLGPR